MRPRSVALAVIVALILLPGCGTMMNLQAPKDPPAEAPTGVMDMAGNTVKVVGPLTCEPFGGINRDTAYAGQASGLGASMSAFGYWADTPFSLVGDLVTLPVVFEPSSAGW